MRVVDRFARGTPVKHVAVTVSGSTAMAPLVHAATRDFRFRTHKLSMSHSESGSLIGLADLLTESADVALSDVSLDAETGLDVHCVAAVAIAFVVHPTAGVRSLTKRQLIDVLLGRSKNWDRFGGADRDIVVVNRNRASGVRACAERSILPGFEIADSGTVAQSDRAAALKVQSIPGAISYVTIPATRGLNIRHLALENVEPTSENVRNGRYALWTQERVIAYPHASDVVKLFVDCMSQCPETYEKLGYIPFERAS
ncbi:MAG: substrate-binding domain-containing protein [Vulcanimicrobiaceae bacterium]